MRKSILLIAVLFCCSFFAGAQSWVVQNTNFPNLTTGVDHISTPTPGVAWILGYDGSGGGANFIDFSRTTDGGNTWIPGTVGTDTGTYAWANISAINDTVAWVCRYNNITDGQGGIWKTSDGGVIWNQQDPTMFQGDSSFADFAHFWDADTGVAVGDPEGGRFEIYTTVNGGTTWTQVPGANIPANLSGEFGIVDYYDVYGGIIWFATNKGRVYKSIDKGHNWTVATVVSLPTTQAMKVHFLDANYGLAMIENATTAAFVSERRTLDGGATWSVLAKTGTFFTSDFGRIPGTSIYISTGAATGWSGSSYSLDSGRTWITLDTTVQHTAYGAYDFDNIWSGNFGDASDGGGIFKLANTPCGDLSLTPGTSVANSDSICFGDTLIVSTTGSLAPFVLDGNVYGFSLIISTIDITGNNDPLNQLPGVIVGGTGVITGVPGATVLPNDTLIFPSGTYYFTPVVYGNATGSGSVFNLSLDPACTYTGNSVMITLLAPGDPSCAVGINNPNPTILSSQAFLKNENTIQVKINASRNDKAVVRIYDITGRVISVYNYSVSQGINSEEINASELRAGTYMISIETTTAKSVTKLVKL
jgi:hypothetical protein